MGTVLIFVSLLTALLNFSVADTTRLEGNVPPPAATWVPEDFITMPGLFQKGDGAPVDTLDIGDSYLQIVLNDDYTWRYIKNRKKLEQEDVFRDYWVENVTNPYAKVTLDDIGYRNSICLIDSVGRFVCPHVGKVSS